MMLAAYRVSAQEQADVRRAVQSLQLAEASALRQIAGSLNDLLDGPFPSQASQQRFDALAVKLGQRLREYFPDLADPDDDDAWVRLAIAYAFSPQENS